ncbi:MAG TPA: MFS transporter [Pirellulaceae bacterium]
MKSSSAADAAAPNAMWLLWAGFMAILAAGVGFAIRGGILDNWGAQFGFNASQLGDINGSGFTGFCFGIIIGGMVADKIGYGKLVFTAFALHVLSAVVTFAAGSGGSTSSNESAYFFLYWGTFIFAVANGTLEAVANPLVATLFPRNRTHYLNILHASWPAGLVLGGAAGWILDDQFNVDWKIQLGLFLVPTLLYGALFFGQKMPKSEASERGLTLGEMFHDVGLMGGAVACFLVALFFGSVLRPIPAIGQNGTYIGYGIGLLLWLGVGGLTKFSLGSVLLTILFATHALVGAVELGTDGWIQNITGNILTSGEGKILFVYTSLLMFLLRFCADFIEKKIGLSPVGILVVCATLACIGLNLTSYVTTFAFALVALTVYGIGKTFFWPTMLAVASDRFPRTGAIAISIMGGIGMMSAGLVGSPGLGYFKDRYAGEELKKADAAMYESYKGDKPSDFLFFPEAVGLDGKKLGEVQAAVRSGTASDEQKKVQEANITGDRRTLRADSFIPATMAVIYLGLLLYFKSIGGYKPVHIDGPPHDAGSGMGLAAPIE